MKYLPSGKIIVNTLYGLREIVEAKKIPLELIDIKESGLKSLDYLFERIDEINGSIDDWDISNIESLEDTFSHSSIQPDLSKWDTSKVINMYATFYRSEFNGDISRWDVSKVNNFNYLFSEGSFDGDISNWKFNKNASAYLIVHNNYNFITKYNNCKEINNDPNQFFFWFEENKNKIEELNIKKEDKDNIDNYLESFELKDILKQ